MQGIKNILEATTLQHKVRTENKYILHRQEIPDVSGIHDYCRAALNLLLSISIFKPNYRYLLEMIIYTKNLHKSWSNTNIK